MTVMVQYLRWPSESAQWPAIAGMASALLAVASDLDSYRRAVDLARHVKRRNRNLFFIGNGGSAAIASHMAADWAKNGRVRARAFNEGPLLTCLANDLGYADVFAEPLRLHGERGDLLFAISSSGQSSNILRAVDVADALAMDVVTLSGFLPDNPLRQRGLVNFYVASTRYGVVEVVHHAICHAILDAVIDADNRYFAAMAKP